jgi:hypothetical protein
MQTKKGFARKQAPNFNKPLEILKKKNLEIQISNNNSQTYCKYEKDCM